MILLNKENLNYFLDNYHYLHDSYITHINYDVVNSSIELLIDVIWSGKPILKENHSYDTNQVKMKMIFSIIKEYNIKEIFSWDYIHKAYINYITLENKEYICFADNEKEPLLYIVCDSIEYEEYK